jgi:hypothetical protein
LLDRNTETIELALTLLKSRKADRGWWMFEGPTYPDVVIETPDAIVVVEGKRTETGPTTCTTWMPNRHQMWRHMDAAWEIRGNRAVFGLFIVAGESDTSGVPSHWRLAASALLSEAAISGSFPHRGPTERDAIVRGFLGVTTWPEVCQRFAIDHDGLPDQLVQSPDAC